ncbi:MAG: class I SAM-dependent methyltransferase [Bacteroidetes bacterium]|nr:class I SAM-dependent methyltransferase [Bacteroidota bacterium]
MYLKRKRKHYERDTHPVLKNGLEKLFPEDQLFSVEASIDTMVPWIEYVCGIVNKNVLVFGTGLGGTSVACALKIGNGKVYGIDISREAVEKTGIKAEAYGVRDKMELVHQEDTYPLRFKDNMFDIVILADVIEHIVNDREKYVREVYRVAKKGGYMIITGTPNVLYAKDRHTTGLYFIPWLSSKAAYRYAVLRKRWKVGENLDYAGRKGTSYWHIKKWLRGFDYEIMNLRKGFTSDYLKKNGRLNTTMRKILFVPYRFTEKILSAVFRIPVTAFMPYINHLFIKKVK